MIVCNPDICGGFAKMKFNLGNIQLLLGKMTPLLV